jgi:LacI family transcriptional regulator
MKRGFQTLSPCPRVTVLVPAYLGWGRNIIKGISAFSNRHGPWHLHIEPEGERRPLPHGWKGDGIIARLSTPGVARTILDVGVPVVNVSGIVLDGPAAKVPRVANDRRASGGMAARHLIERGFRTFAYVGPPKLAYVREHQDAFTAALDREGHACHLHALGQGTERAGRPSRLIEWLRSLPKPVAILTWSNVQGRAIIDACRQESLLVPEDVAVLSGDDDPVLCESCLPQLSAIGVASEQIGEKAAELMQLLIERRQLPPTPILLPPLGIITRQSTDTLAIDNPDLVQAIGFIREHATQNIHVDDVLRAVPVSRRSLERMFHDSLGRSPAQEIRRVRIERAKQLLATTDLPIPKVAVAAGFGTGEYLATIFRQATGMTPLKYRTLVRNQ